MNEPATIQLNSQQQNSQSFGYLREEGLKVIQRLAPESWTDHNLHDPGITLLEALAYTITEAGLRTGLEMPDLLTSGEQQAPQEFFTAAEVLPSAPVTLRDFQKVLLDHPLIKMGWVSVLYGEPLGRLSVLLEYENEELNSNVVKAGVSVSGNEYNIEIAFPYWDDPEMAALQQDVAIETIGFLPPVNPWQLIAGSDAYFARIQVDYTPQGGSPLNFEGWVVLQITSPVADPSSQLPLILQAATNHLQSIGDNSETDLSILKQYNRRVTAAFETSRVVRRYIKAYRNLCEIFALFNAVRLQEVAITANIEVAPNVEVENLLADIFLEVHRHISPDVFTASLAELKEKGLDTARIFDGPLPHYGLVEVEQLDTNLPSNKLYTSDILRLIFQLRNPDGSDVQRREELAGRSIVAVRNLSLSLYIDNRRITADAKDCLQLINSIRHVPRFSPGKSRVTFLRNNIEVKYDASRAIALFQQKKTRTATAGNAAKPDIPLPVGTAYPVGNYYPVQNSLPATYGVGENGLSITATSQRKAQAKQLKGYLFIFEQILAGYLSQLENINAFFSANAQSKQTLFHQPLYHLPGVADVLMGFQPDAPDTLKKDLWENFTANENNAYRTVLNNALESENQFLDRRHRMLDHLLARLGESMADYAAMLYRESLYLPETSGLTTTQVQSLQESRRLQTAHRLLHDKAAFYYDLPYLHENRFQSFSLSDKRKEALISVQQLPDGFQWQIHNSAGSPFLQGGSAEPTALLAQVKAEELLALATSGLAYSAVAMPGGLWLLAVRSSANQEPGGFSVQSFPTDADALTAIDSIRDELLEMLIRFGLSPLELRLHHLLGLPAKGERPPLRLSLNEYFELFDDGIFKKFRLHQSPGPAGPALLESEDNYQDNDEANAAIEVLVRNGLLAENYVISGSGGSFELSLTRLDQTVIARSPAVFASEAEARERAGLIRSILQAYYHRGEGFYMIEHILLFPASAGEAGLEIIDAINPCQPVLSTRKDPYSFQITFVFPSGYSRAFPSGERKNAQPYRFRDEEFRAYVETTIRSACPGHILPVVRWADSDSNQTPLPSDPTADQSSFDHFEARYRQWLRAYFTDEVPETVIGPRRNALSSILQKLYAPGQ